MSSCEKGSFTNVSYYYNGCMGIDLAKNTMVVCACADAVRITIFKLWMIITSDFMCSELFGWP